MNRSLTEGPIARSMIAFALPMLIGNLFQQLYSMVDAVIVGRLLGKTALAAVSICVSPNYLMTDLFTGLSVGAGIVIAQAYGAKDELRLHRSVHTTIALSAITGLAVAILAWFIAHPMMLWLNAPSDAFNEAVTYFRFYFIGALGMSLYNCGNAILRSVGDSIRPLIYLVITSVVNAILDVVFISFFHLGVGSVAVATSIAQSLSAVLCLYRLSKYDTPYRVYLSRIRIHKDIFPRIVRFSIPTGIQSSMISISNVIIGASINIFGSAVIAGSGIWFRLQGFALMPVVAMMQALSTYVAQNTGAQRYDRIARGTRVGIYICVGLSLLATLILLPLMHPLAAVFSHDASVIDNAIIMSRVLGPFILLLSFTHAIGGTLQGAGWVKQSMWTYVLCWCVVRAIICIGVVRIHPVIELVYMSYPITWIMSASVFLYYYLKLMRSYKEK